MDSPPDPEDLIPILGNLLEATALPRPDLVAVLLPPADVQQGKLELWKVGVGLAANELAAGVSREAQAGATLNALRLARHLFEYLLCARYVLADPVERLDEAYGDEAAERRKIRRFAQDLQPNTAEALLAVQEQDALLAAAEQRKSSGGRADLPNRADMARTLGLDDEYNHYYRASSWLAHPGLAGTSESYLVTSPDFSLSTRPGGLSDPSVIQSALALACVALHGIFAALGDVPPLWPDVTSRIATVVRNTDGCV